MSESRQQFPWGVEQRLRFIEMCLFWFGKINRCNIIKQFGVSVQQASYDLTRYQEAARENVYYDRSQKRYIATEKFEPHFYKPHIQDFFSEIVSVTEGRSGIQESWFILKPQAEVMPVISRPIDVNVLRSLVLAVCNGQAIEIFYQSILPEFPEPEWYWISPHAFQNDGFRWYIRAYCHSEQKFKYFKLSRILDVAGFGEQAASVETDRFWREYFDVVLVPNKTLSSSQQKAVAQQYKMREGRLSVPVRKSILSHFETWINIHLKESFNLLRESPLMIENRVELENVLTEMLS